MKFKQVFTGKSLNLQGMLTDSAGSKYLKVMGNIPSDVDISYPFLSILPDINTNALAQDTNGVLTFPLAVLVFGHCEYGASPLPVSLVTYKVCGNCPVTGDYKAFEIWDSNGVLILRLGGVAANQADPDRPGYYEINTPALYIFSFHESVARFDCYNGKNNNRIVNSSTNCSGYSNPDALWSVYYSSSYDMYNNVSNLSWLTVDVEPIWDGSLNPEAIGQEIISIMEPVITAEIDLAVSTAASEMRTAINDSYVSV